MGNCKPLKSRKKKRLPQASSFSDTRGLAFHSSAVHSASATTFAASADVRSDDSVSGYWPYSTSLARRCSLVLTLMLASSIFPPLHDYLPIPTGVLAEGQAHPSEPAGMSRAFLPGEHASVAKIMNGALSTKSSPRNSSADQHGIMATPSASSNEEGPSKAAEAGGRPLARPPLPILVRRPYLTDHPELTRLPLSIDSDLTDEAFEAVEQASFQIARAVRLQQQREQRRAREEQYLGGALRPSPDMQPSYSSTTAPNGRLGREDIEGLAGTATQRSAAHTRPAGQYKFVESSPPASSTVGDKHSTWSDGEVDEYGEAEAPASGHSKTDSVGGRLIVGLTEITFPDMKHSTNTPEKNTVRESEGNSSIMREDTEGSSGKHHGGAGGGEGWWTDGDGHDGNPPGMLNNGEGKPLSHEEAVREANLRLRLERLKDLRIVKRVKVLENVGLVILELENHLSVEDIKEAVKTLWQRNRSTWLIEPDSEVVFRGRDSFERGDFVPVVPSEEEQVRGADHTEKATPASEQQIRSSLSGQDEPPEQHRWQNFGPKEPGSQQKNIRRTSTRSKRSHVLNVAAQDRGIVNTPLTSRSRRVEAAAPTVENVEPLPQHDKPTSSGQALGNSARSSVFDVSRGNAKEATDSTRERLQKIEAKRKIYINTARGNVARAATKRDLGMDSLAPPPLQGVQNRVRTYALDSMEGREAARQGSRRGWDEAHHQMEREATKSGALRNTTYDTTARGEVDAGLESAEHPAQKIGTETLFYASGAREGTVEHAPSFTTPYRQPASLLKPHTGIVSLSLYDAAQKAVQEAVEEQIAFRSVQGLPSYVGREECLKAFAACEQRPDFAVENIDTHTTYAGSSYSSKNTSATERRSSTTARRGNSNGDNYTNDGLPDGLFQTSDEQTSNEEQCKTQMETEAVESGVTEGDAPVAGTTVLERSSVATPAVESGVTEGDTPVAGTAVVESSSVATPAVESGLTEGDAPVAGTAVLESSSVATPAVSAGAIVQPEVGEGAPEEGESSAMVQNAGSSQEPPEDSAQRRIIFASSVAPVGEKHLPNDQYFSRQWAYHGPRVNVQAVEAWNLVYKHRLTSHRKREDVNGRSKRVNHKNVPPAAASGNVEPIIVAVIDTGIDYTHEDLSTQMWTNKGEIPDNGIDDDGNGYVDDYYGYNFEKDESDPMDYNGHGTHVAGIIGAAANNKRGITGVNWEVKLMPLKFTARSAAAAEAIDYSLRMGAQISTNSWGYASPSAGLKLALKKTATKGQLFVSAVDNAGRDNTYTSDYPPNWGYDKRTKQGARNILRVANLTAAGGVSGTSNFGPHNVDVVAPGTDIISTVPTRRFPEGYGYKTGTSMATPLVAGIAAMVWSAQPSLTPGDVRDCIVRTSTRLRTLESFVIAGNVNAYAAVLDVLGHPKESSSDRKSGDFGPPGSPPANDVIPPTAVAALPGSALFYKTISPLLVNGNLFPSEEAFFQHIAQAQPYFVPPVVVDPPHKLSKPSTAAEVKFDSGSASAKASAPASNPLLSNIASMLGPLHKLLFLEQ